MCFLVCQDLQDEILCSEAEKAGNCDQLPWNGKCRKTCGRCGTFISTFLVPYPRSLLWQSLIPNFCNLFSENPFLSPLTYLMPKFTENCWRIALPFWKRPHPVFHQEILGFPESRTIFRSNLGSWEYTFRPRFWIKKSTERSVATSRFRMSFCWDTRTGSYCNVHTNCFNLRVGKTAKRQF